MAGTFSAESLPRSFRIAPYAVSQFVGFAMPVTAVPLEVSIAVRKVSASSTSAAAADLVYASSDWFACAASMSSTRKSKLFSWSMVISMPVDSTASGTVVRGTLAPPDAVTAPVL